MKVFEVGGCVRDTFMDVEPNDIDFVVVDANEVELKMQGFKRVGNDFPVFLHPQTKDEWALARRERKTGSGYNGFEFDIENVTIEEDLSRRDFTINAMARDVDTGEVIDPFNGQYDIERRFLKAVSLDTFVEDPVRVLRLARFAARFGNRWSIDQETLFAAMRVVKSDDWKALTKERVWKETEKALMTSNPDIFFRVLESLGDKVWFKELMDCRQCPQPPQHHPEGDVFEHTMQGLKVAADKGYGLDVRFAVICHDLGKPISYAAQGNLHGHEDAGTEPVNDICDRLCVPSFTRRAALVVTINHLKVHKIMELKASTIVKMLTQMRAYQSQQLVKTLAEACECDALARNNPDAEYPQAKILLDFTRVAETATRGIATDLYKSGKTGVEIGNRIHAARVHAVKEFRRNMTAE